MATSDAPGRPAAARVRAIAVLFLALMAAGGCRHRDQDEYQPSYGNEPAGGKPKRQYSFGVVPLHNPVRLQEVFQPLMAAVERQAEGLTLQVESSRDFARHEQKLRDGALDLSILNPYEAVTAEKHGYRIFAKMGEDDLFRGIIVVRKDARIRDVEDLRGKTITFPAPTALAATLMVKDFLFHRGLNVDAETNVQYVGSQDSTVMNVYRGLAAAGGTWPSTWETLKRERPEVIAAMEIKWRTPPLPTMAVVARKDLPAKDRAAIAGALFSLHRSEEGRAILARIGVAHFQPADAGTYEPIRRFLRDYAEHFGKLPELAGVGE